MADLPLGTHVELAGTIYRVDSLEGPQSPHWPIVLTPISRPREYLDWVDAQVIQERKASPGRPREHYDTLRDLLTNGSINVDTAWMANRGAKVVVERVGGGR